MTVKIEIIKDYEKQGRTILKKGGVYVVSKDTAAVLIDTKKVAKIFGSTPKEPKTKK